MLEGRPIPRFVVIDEMHLISDETMAATMAIVAAESGHVIAVGQTPYTAKPSVEFSGSTALDD